MQILKRKSDMAFFKLLLSGSLIFSIAMAYDTESLFAISDNMIMPRHYNIKFIPFIKQGFFYAECNITINILNPTINISFFAENLGIIDVMLINNTYNSKANKEKINKYYPTTYLYNTETHIASAHFAHELSSGHYILNINFVGIIANNVGGFRVFHINESDYLQSMIYLSATNFQPNSVRELFPCFDVFAMVTFNISIKHSGYYRALSNMPIRDEIYEMYDMQWTYFETTPIMSTCLMTVVVTNFLVVRDEKTTVQMWCRRSLKAHAKFAFDIIIRMIQYLKSEWQYIEKFPKIDYIAIPISLLENISTVSVGLVVYSKKL
ncbi:glutamyl aminopeptidase-like [Anoplolepis gracilipes]|uniref:glutamyl aminopeptidase-like n=1 Tax=Anoplolepis gracilipes TaxID=354296 RepID=UPI003BA059D7